MDLSSRLSGLRALADQAALTGTQVGLEKEGLRVAQKGGVAMTAHPASLGSPLTNPWITTDYSEALLELITPPCEGNHAAIEFLHQLHCFLHQHLGEEILWTSSMPCILAGEENIPIAEYGNSNAGKMKRIYRVGLGYRYGKTMQVIAGIHYNFSFPAEFWAVYQRVLKDSRDQRAFIDDAYMGMIRNIQRIGWMITYLFGASPAVCKSFFSEMPNMPEFDDSTYFEPWATSLRTGDIGYQNSQETGMGVQISYDNLDTYVAGLADAISTPAPLWERIGVKVNGDYRQLNANILQIENEYYSSIRPKQPPIGMEKPLRALQRRGIQYVELRSLDINPYLPTGLDEEQLNFLEVFMFYCLLQRSDTVSLGERWEIDRNLLQVAHAGRAPGLKLLRLGEKVCLHDWAREVLVEMTPVAELLDQAYGNEARSKALMAQLKKIDDPDQTPSARLLADMRANDESFYDIANRLSRHHTRYYRNQQPELQFKEQVEAVIAESVQAQQVIDAREEVDFDTFLAAYQAS